MAFQIPPRTHWIRDAEARGCPVMDGLAMLVAQGVIGIKHWTGIDVDADVVRKALEEALSLEGEPIEGTSVEAVNRATAVPQEYCEKKGWLCRTPIVSRSLVSSANRSSI